MSDTLHIAKRDRHGNKVWMTIDERWTRDFSKRARYDGLYRIVLLMRAADLGAEVERA